MNEVEKGKIADVKRYARVKKVNWFPIYFFAKNNKGAFTNKKVEAKRS